MTRDDLKSQIKEDLKTRHLDRKASRQGSVASLPPESPATSSSAASFTSTEGRRPSDASTSGTSIDSQPTTTKIGRFQKAKISLQARLDTAKLVRSDMVGSTDGRKDEILASARSRRESVYLDKQAAKAAGTSQTLAQSGPAEKDPVGFDSQGAISAFATVKHPVTKAEEPLRVRIAFNKSSLQNFLLCSPPDKRTMGDYVAANKDAIKDMSVGAHFMEPENFEALKGRMDMSKLNLSDHEKEAFDAMAQKITDSPSFKKAYIDFQRQNRPEPAERSSAELPATAGARTFAEMAAHNGFADRLGKAEEPKKSFFGRTRATEEKDPVGFESRGAVSAFVSVKDPSTGHMEPLRIRVKCDVRTVNDFVMRAPLDKRTLADYLAVNKSAIQDFSIGARPLDRTQAEALWEGMDISKLELPSNEVAAFDKLVQKLVSS